MFASEKKYLKAEPIVAWVSFLILLLTYWFTVAPTVSLWDCPEYVSAAWLLEVGHPPGNPTWMLVERIITMLAPSAKYAALAVNLSSGLFTAFAAYFLAKTIFRVALWVLLKLPRRHIPAPLAAAGGSLCATLMFGWGDSVWFSAVEAEVYAMSLFMTSLCVWLMTKWAGTRNEQESRRLLILLAYLFGLSIGIHQLNLLCIPALAMIWAVRRGIRTPLKLALIFLLSLVAVACILMGMMPSTIALAAQFEIFAVNILHLPELSGVVIYILLLGLSLLVAIVATTVSNNRILISTLCFPAIFLSGVCIFGDRFLAGMIASAIVSMALACGRNYKDHRLSLAIWMLAMMLMGYSSYALIPIRGSVPSPANSAMPDDPFSFAYYQSREQYGAAPLLYGNTPYSKPMYAEQYDANGKANYRKFAVNNGHAIYSPVSEHGVYIHNPRISREDSLLNAQLMENGERGYIKRGYTIKNRLTPELNMWFPRITSRNPRDLISYSDWVGMDTSTMVRVNITEAYDSVGNPVARVAGNGERSHPFSYRPTYLQNLQWLLTYQTGYMYWRYLMWNFSGRQNDVHSQGEVQHGNFITGYPAIDNAMLGAEDDLPPFAGRDNAGRNRYFLLPLLLGIFGMAWLLKSGKRGMQTCAITAVLFIMTGIAIVIYLNQNPCEPRERDYSFLGSYLAYCIWVGFGAIFIARRFRSVWGFALPMALSIWVGIENFDDHNRSGRYVASVAPRNILNSLEKDAIIFVNGDNLTFPLWYAQEVEGVRRDVRIVNLAYLSANSYAANFTKDWRDSKRLPMTLTYQDIIWGSVNNCRVLSKSDSIINAVDALEELRRSGDKAFAHRFVRIPVSPDSTIVYDLRNVARAGTLNIPVHSLLMFDIIATNASSAAPRPIYWLNALGKDKQHGFTDYTSVSLYARQFGVMPPQRVDSLLLASLAKLESPNHRRDDIYMDHAPAQQLSIMRGAMLAATKRLLNDGYIVEADRWVREADRLPGNHYDSYAPVVGPDSVIHTRRFMGELMLEIADSLENNRLTDGVRIMELRARGRYHLHEAASRKQAWRNYKEALPARLRSKMSPVY